MPSRAGATAWMCGTRAVALLSATAASIALGLGLAQERLLSSAYFWRNEAEDGSRVGLLAGVFGFSAVVGLASVVAWTRGRAQEAAGPVRLWRLARLSSPLGPLALIPCLMRWDVWQGHDLTFLLAAFLVALFTGATVSAAVTAGPLGLGSLLSSAHSRLRRLLPKPGAPGGMAFWVVACASLAYIVWFSYFTSVWHLSVRSGYDTAIEDNILWNISHGGPFFKATPTLGPIGSHFRRHATLISYVLAPFYLIHPGAAIVLVMQSVIQGIAAVPLFLFARRRIGGAAAALVAVLYLFHPALQQSNLFEIHYVKFGPAFFWTTLWLLDSGRHRLAILAAVVTVTVREDVATWVILMGLWGLWTGRSPRTSLGITLFAGLYVGIVKFGIMTALAHGEDELTFMYAELLPRGKNGFAWVLATVFGNPPFTIESLLDLGKLVFFLQAFVPLVLYPLRRPIGWFALIPWGIFCLISTHYAPLVDIHFQYSAHLLAFVFPALVLVLESQDPRSEALLSKPGVGQEPSAISLRNPLARNPGVIASLLVGTLLCTYQYGAVLQQNTSRGGPIPYKFGWDAEGHTRRRAVDALLDVVPPRARITASAFTVTQVSARPNAYSLSLAIYDAEWLIAPTNKREYVADELARTSEALRSQQWGVVKIVEPFFVARRGAPTGLNAQLFAVLDRS